MQYQMHTVDPSFLSTRGEIVIGWCWPQKWSLNVLHAWRTCMQSKKSKTTHICALTIHLLSPLKWWKSRCHLEINRYAVNSVDFYPVLRAISNKIMQAKQALLQRRMLYVVCTKQKTHQRPTPPVKWKLRLVQTGVSDRLNHETSTVIPNTISARKQTTRTAAEHQRHCSTQALSREATQLNEPSTCFCSETQSQQQQLRQ